MWILKLWIHIWIHTWITWYGNQGVPNMEIRVLQIRMTTQTLVLAQRRLRVTESVRLAAASEGEQQSHRWGGQWRVMEGGLLQDSASDSGRGELARLAAAHDGGPRRDPVSDSGHSELHRLANTWAMAPEWRRAAASDSGRGEWWRAAASIFERKLCKFAHQATKAVYNLFICCSRHLKPWPQHGSALSSASNSCSRAFIRVAQAAESAPMKLLQPASRGGQRQARIMDAGPVTVSWPRGHAVSLCPGCCSYAVCATHWGPLPRAVSPSTPLTCSALALVFWVYC